MEKSIIGLLHTPMKDFIAERFNCSMFREHDPHNEYLKKDILFIHGRVLGLMKVLSLVDKNMAGYTIPDEDGEIKKIIIRTLNNDYEIDITDQEDDDTIKIKRINKDIKAKQRGTILQEDVTISTKNDYLIEYQRTYLSGGVNLYSNDHAALSCCENLLARLEMDLRK